MNLDKLGRPWFLIAGFVQLQVINEIKVQFHSNQHGSCSARIAAESEFLQDRISVFYPLRSWISWQVEIPTAHAGCVDTLDSLWCRWKQRSKKFGKAWHSRRIAQLNRGCPLAPSYGDCFYAKLQLKWRESLGLPLRPRQFLWSCSPFALDSTGALRQWQGDLQMFESRGREKRWIVGWYAGAGLGEFHPDPFGETTGQGQAQNRRKAPCQKGQQEQTSRWMWIDEIDLNWPCNHIWDYLSAINLIPSR